MWKVTEFEVFLVRIFPHSDWIRRFTKWKCGKIRTRKTANTYAFYALHLLLKGTGLLVNPFQPSVAFYTKTSHMICGVNRMTGFYIKCNTGLKWINLKKIWYEKTQKFLGCYSTSKQMFVVVKHLWWSVLFFCGFGPLRILPKDSIKDI